MASSKHIIYTSRCVCDQQTQKLLFRGHEIFNSCVRTAITSLFDIYNGRGKLLHQPQHIKDICRSLVELAMVKVDISDYITNAFSRIDWKPKCAIKVSENKFGPERTKKLFDDYQANSKIIASLLSKTDIHPFGKIREIAIEAAVAKLKAYVAIKKLSDRNRRKQRLKFTKFIKNNQDFMNNALPEIKKWETKHGAIKNNRLRWHRYLKWIATNSRLVTWRDKNATIDSDQNRKLISGQIKYRKKFFQLNPELHALDNTYKEYRKLRRIDKPAIFTLPSAIHHPTWLMLYRTNTQRNLNINGESLGSVEVRVPTVDGLSPWLTVKFAADKRLVNANVREQTVTLKNKRQTIAPVGTIDGDISIRLTNISLRYKFPNKMPIFAFTAECTSQWKTPDKTKPAIYVSADLGIRYPAYCAVATSHKNDIKFSKFIAIKSLPHTKTIRGIDGLHRRIARSRSLTGRVTKHHGSKLQKHKRNVIIDRARKTASAIMKIALDAKRANPDLACYIVIEDLKTLLPSLEKNRFANNRITTMLHGVIKFYLESIASRHGIMVRTVMSNGTSRVCGVCGHLGGRFTQSNNKVKLAYCGPLFWCVNCKKQRNSDLNAAINLIKVAVDKSWMVNWKQYVSKSSEDKQKFRAMIGDELLAYMKQRASSTNCSCVN